MLAHAAVDKHSLECTNDFEHMNQWTYMSEDDDAAHEDAMLDLNEKIFKLIQALLLKLDSDALQMFREADDANEIKSKYITEERGLLHEVI